VNASATFWQLPESEPFPPDLRGRHVIAINGL
jgi:hypothetical protein